MAKAACVCLLVALFGGSWAVDSMGRIETNRKNREVRIRPAIVAREDIPMGTLIDVPEKYFTWQVVNSYELPANSVRNYADLENRRVKRVVKRGEAPGVSDLLESTLSGNPYNSAWANCSCSIEMWKPPHNHIRTQTLVYAIRLRQLENGQTEARTILADLPVLGIAEQNPTESEPRRLLRVVLKTTPEESLILQSAQNEGEVYLAPQFNWTETRLPAGKRAMTFRMYASKEGAVCLPGQCVDVTWVGSEGQERITRKVMTGVPVLAGPFLDSSTWKHSMPDFVTLEVPVERALELIQFQATGDLHFAASQP